MPMIPSAQGPGVLTQPAPSLQAPLEAFGGGQAARTPDLSGVANEAAREYQVGKQHANEIAVTDAGAKLSALETQLLWDPEHGAMTRRGKDAFSAQDDAQQAWTEETSSIANSLSNDDQKLAFSRMVAAHGAALTEQLARHVATERQAYDGEVTTNYVTNERNAAVANFTDAQRITESIANQTASLTDFARRNGLPAEWLQAHVAQSVSDTHVAVIDRMLANDMDGAAKAYRDAHKDEIGADHAAAVDKAVEEGSSRAESQHQFDTITAAGGTLSEQIAKARTIEDPRVRDLTEARLRQNDAETKAAERDQREQTMTTAGNILDATRGNLNKIPAAMWSAFTPAEKSSLSGYATQLQGGPQKQQTDWQTWVDLREMAANPSTRQAFLNLDPMSYRGKLADAQFQEMVGLREGLKGKDDTTTAKLDTLNYRHAIITNALHGIGLLTDPKRAGSERPEAAVLYRSVDAAVEDLQHAQQKPATPKQVQEITDELLTQHVVARSPSFFDFNQSRSTTKRLFQLAPQDSLVVTAKDISAPNRAAIASSLRARGLPATEANILAAYQAHLKSLVRRGPE